MLIPLLIFCFLSLLTLAISLRGRRIDTHPTCRRCKFDLINLPSTICPECGANLEAPKAIRIGNRQRLRRLALFSCFLLLIGAAGSGLSIYGTTKKIDWYTYKPVWWLRLDAKHGSQESVTHAINELLARNDNNKLTQGDRDAISSSLMSALESAHLPNPSPYGHALSELLKNGPLSESARNDLITWLLKLQADPAKPWSTELGTAFLAECIAKRIPEELMAQFLRQSCSPVISTTVNRPLRPGEHIPIALSLNPRSGKSLVDVTWYLPGLASDDDKSSRTSVRIPTSGVAILGTLIAPETPGTYTLEGELSTYLRAEDLTRNPRTRQPRIESPNAPEFRRQWPIRLTYQVADTRPPPQDDLRDFAERLFWVGAVEPDYAKAHSCTLYANAPSIPMSVEFDVLWKYQGTVFPAGSGTLSLTSRGFASSYRSQSSRGSSSGGTSAGMKPRPERYSMYIPTPTGPATTGAIIIHITKLTFDGAPPEPFIPFDLEFPNTKVHW